MMILTSGADHYAQFITVLVLFVIVLGVTAWTTRWISRYQKQQNNRLNVEILETTRIAPNKYIQIVRTGKHIFAIAVCKDTVTLLGELSGEELSMEKTPAGDSFRTFFDKALKKADSSLHDEKENNI